MFAVLCTVGLELSALELRCWSRKSNFDEAHFDGAHFDEANYRLTELTLTESAWAMRGDRPPQ